MRSEDLTELKKAMLNRKRAGKGVELPQEARQSFKEAVGEDGLKSVTKANNQLAKKLYGELEAGNLFFSPYSILLALSMTYVGARGTTAAQIASALHLPEATDTLTKGIDALRQYFAALDEHELIQLRQANRLWPSRQYANTLQDAFINTIQAEFDAPLTPIDFSQAAEAASEINRWVENQTESRIKDLIPANLLSAATTLVLVNAVYFKGNWAHQFDPNRTYDRDFHLSDDHRIKVPMMAQTDRFRYGVTGHEEVIELPYKGNTLSMLIVLPKPGVDISYAESKIAFTGFHAWDRRLAKTKVVVSLPKFRLETAYSLVEPLQALGIEDAFTDKADFSGMTSDPQGFLIDQVIHKGFVEVNETGTEAAVATAVVMTLTGAPPAPIPVFNANRPFLFAIRENQSGLVLFAGRVVDPR